MCLTPFLSSSAVIVQIIVVVDEDVVPLSLAHVGPASEYLRHTAVFPAPAIELKKYANYPTSASHIPAIDIILSYEQSPRWPEDLAAIQKLKLAFLEAIGSHLKSSKAVSFAAVAL